MHVHRPKQRTSNTQKNYCTQWLLMLNSAATFALILGLVVLNFYRGSHYLGSGRWLFRDPWGCCHRGKLSSQSTFLSDPSPPWEEEDFSFCFVPGLESGSPTCSCSSPRLKPDPIQQLHKSLGTGLQQGVEQLGAHGEVTPSSPAGLHLP